ncbi:Alkaline phosphatase synthesis sensor protein PhoR [Aliiroseovarius sp. xm-m-379]|uniref:ATP-binding protein n=1 Tax=unclassified Aliiroseovarius TaxID=2623558 RepID=UPI001A0C4BF4|nr:MULTISPECIES: ATP-binding protein [unclassified Aliiroseovarius]NRP11913.1 Alkaline phosphatase synthesis sensor protein PhoR [Aliiroseovarius sp. xm-d-517]NRP25136.1 Alkaline phosphatase synthesis sensor protein PhoR [Aliiroseovarius sp. xm-m-379]NRP31131.1 Alkaline phosphatase synthesis sensor protein PhoR [Aliiroseovarius sp. xm-m-314]NRP33935.1 Alkaline phosphatase synthesis sensor protein PhoR [Aliiroseovarius sp. xm-a-104]NRP41593.1 Alkaline phosphatase synthesis sensor protein PhoR [
MASAGKYDAIPIPIMEIAADGQICELNGAGQDLFGARALGRLYAAVLRQPVLLARIENALTGELASPVRYLTNEATRDVIYETHVTPGLQGSVVLSFLDITHKEEAGQMRADFVANVSHELRTPLTALSGFIETLRGPAREDAEARLRFLDIMEQEAGRMNRLVGDLLSLSRVEDMERVRPTDPQSIREILAAAVSMLRPQIDEQDVTLNLLLPQDIDDKVPGDRDQLLQVFTNLIENAVKYGRKGGIVEIFLETRRDQPGMKGPVLSVTVADQGEGIAAHHIGRLTERFYRVDGHRSREMGGTGLGLAIVKHILNRHRGRLRIESDVGKGSRFIVTLPRIG